MNQRQLIQGARLIDPSSGLDMVGDIAIERGKVVALGAAGADFRPDAVIDARGLVAMPGLVDLAVRLREPGYEHASMLATELRAASAGGVTTLVCPPDTDPVLDEPGLIETLRYRAQAQQQSRVYAQGALTRGLKGTVLTELAALAEAGCVAFGQAEVPITDTQVLYRAFQYAATFGYSVWLRPLDASLGKGVAASGPLATRMGLPGVPVTAETIALFAILELMRSTGARVHLCRLSSAAAVEMLRQAKRESLPITADVSVHSLHLCDVDIGYYDSRSRVNPVLRQSTDRAALRQALADGTIDALVSDHTPVEEDAKALPFAEAEPEATAAELLLSLALQWSHADHVPLATALARLTTGPATVLHAGRAGAHVQAGRLAVGTSADICLFDPQAHWQVKGSQLLSQGKHTPFEGIELPGRVRFTLVGGRVAYQAP
jgi:dihydroorotase